MEAPLHAVMPHRIVVHVHAINTVCWAVRDDGPSRLLTLLDGLSWRWIPYIASGLPLALELRRVASSAPDVLVLANHGLVIGADTFEAAEALLLDIEQRLALRPRIGPEPSWSQLERMAASASCWRVPLDADLHALGTDATCRAILGSGALYPCQVVFLGPTASIAAGGSVAHAEQNHRQRHGVSPELLIVEGSGVLVRPQMTVAQTQVLEGLCQVVRRLDLQDPIRYLTAADLAELYSADAHQYRSRVENSWLEPFAK
jgi:rhamnose utilization protein RhaD (predicted bifunctional aldolase and dehydrogenase)